jgi:hypothetical protein
LSDTIVGDAGTASGDDQDYHQTCLPQNGMTPCGDPSWEPKNTPSPVATGIGGRNDKKRLIEFLL